MERSYEKFLEDLNREVARGDEFGIVPIYHKVRRIPYGAAGRRDPRAVRENNVGSCSGKHILLRDLLRQVGIEAEVITIFAHFNKGIPDHQAFPEELRRLIRDEQICDFHHYVRAKPQFEDWLRLDATWHDALEPYGFPVNSGWCGEGDTVIAAETIREYPPADDIAALKVRLLEELTPEQRAKRARFFELLGDWIGTLSGSGPNA